MDKFIKTHNFITNRWKDGLKENREGDYALPYPFVPPCIDGLFKCLFYWDTFFTNRGLIIDGKLEYAKWNVDNLIYLLKKYRFVPNSNSYPGVKHNSQPPFLQYMIEDIYNETKDINWLKDSYEALKIEYEFWMKNRMTSCGLNQYLHHEKTNQEKLEFYDYVSTRLSLDKNAPLESKLKAGSSYNASCESGIDLAPTIGEDGPDMVEVDLNAHLWAMEGRLAKWAKIFEPELEERFLNAQKHRKALMDKLMFDKTLNVYWDYNFVKKEFEQTNFSFTCQFLPFIVGMLSDKKAVKYLLLKLEYEFGIATTEKYEFKYEHQGAYPYSWPYDNYFAFRAAKNVGLEDDAKRIAFKYMNACANSYTITGHLWELYDATKDGIALKKEYPNAEMLGWTAGVYQYLYKFYFN